MALSTRADTRRRIRNARGRGRQHLSVRRPDGYTAYSDEKEITVGVNGVVPGIRVSLWLGADGETVYLEAYDWSSRPLTIVSTTTGEPIDLKVRRRHDGDRPHPELAIVIGEVPT